MTSFNTSNVHVLISSLLNSRKLGHTEHLIKTAPSGSVIIAVNNEHKRVLQALARAQDRISLAIVNAGDIHVSYSSYGIPSKQIYFDNYTTLVLLQDFITQINLKDEEISKLKSEISKFKGVVE